LPLPGPARRASRAGLRGASRVARGDARDVPARARAGVLRAPRRPQHGLSAHGATRLIEGVASAAELKSVHPRADASCERVERLRDATNTEGASDGGRIADRPGVRLLARGARRG